MIITKKEFIDENIILLPLCSPVFIRYADNLRNNYKFMDAFKVLFSSFNHYTSNVAQYVIKSFRIAIMNEHGVDYIKQMIHVVFQSSPVKPGKISPFDVFFSTFTDLSSQLTKYFSGFDYDDFFADLKQRNDLPPSFLRFLIDLSEYFPFSTDMLWSYSVRHPFLLFTYISHLDFDHITKTWIAIFERMTSLPRTDQSLDWHITILLFFLSHTRSHPDLMKTFLAKKVHQWMISVLWSIRLESMSDRKNAFLAITLIFTRIDEIIARTLSANVVFKDLFDNYTDNKSNIDVIGKIILWILIPNQAFPFHNQLRNEVLVSNNVGISMTFTKEIIPNLLSLYLKLGIQSTPLSENFLEFLETLVKIAVEDNYRQFLLGKTLTEDLLMIFVQHWNEHPIIFKFIAVSLSLNCNFYVFSKIFNNISSDLAKTIEFLNILSENTPLVNDFLHIDSPFPFNSNMMNGSIVMWVRLHSNLSQIIQIVSGKHKIVFANNSNNVYVQDNEKIICKFPLGQGIEGWHLCHIRLETKRSSFSFDLNEKHVDIPLDSTTSLTLGGVDVSFDIQSLRLFRPALHKSELLYLFSLGPNMKEFLYRDFVSIAYQTPSFVIGNSFISSLYTEWVNLLYSNVEEKEIFGKKFELSISPPFQEIISMRRSAIASDNNKKETILTSLTDNTPLFSNRLQFKDFINSLEAFGGSAIIAHIIAEAILKHPDQQRGAIKLLHNLVNRFPLFHVSFVKKKLYQALGQLLWTPNLDFHVIEDYAVTFYHENIILCNVHLLKNFLFGPTLYHCNLSNLITMINRSIANGPYSDHNRSVLIKMDAFTLIIQSISNSTQHTRGFLDVLANLASSITDKTSAQTYISKLFSFIMINHLSFSLSDSNTDEAFDASTPLSEFRSRVACPASLRSTKSTVTMISLLTTLLSKYRANIDIKLMLGAFITSSVKVQISLIDLLLKNVESQNLLYIFGFVIIHLGNSSKIAQYLYAFGQAMMNPLIFRIHYITIPILYMISHEGYNEYISALASASILTLKQMKTIETICYEHMLMIIKIVEDRFLVPQIITIDSNSFSSTVSPLSNFFTVILQKCLENEDYYMLEKFFISIFAFKTIPDYRLSCVSLFLLARIIENTQNKIKSIFINFVVTFASFVFNRIYLIPGEKSELLSNILVYFIRQVLENVEDINNNETINKVFDMLDDFASLNTSNTNLILEDVKRHKKLNKNKRAFETIDRLENPTSFAPNRAKKPSFDQDLKKFEEIVLERDKKDVTALLTIVCNAISYQALHASDVTTVGVKIDTMIDTWHEVFQSLMGESSIFGDCPPKYCLNETTTDPSVRRILFPLNPAIDRVYLSYWKEKYQKPPPKVRLTLADVMQFAPSLYMEDDILFNGDAVRLAGISMLKGVIVVTKDSIKFYQKPKSDSFFEELMRIKISDLRSIRLTMFQHLPKGIIIEDNMECLFLFALETPSLRDRFVDILQGIGVKVMSGINKEELSKATQMWCEGKLSTFNYILKLNFISGRSWSDFTQFPIFPWTITDFTSETPRGFRDFRYPIFAQTSQQQKSLTDYYNATLQMNIEPYNFANYVSNVGSSLYFLIRLEPFTDELITFQSGSFDAADRTFQSMQITKELMMSSSAKSALEMVAEIYLIPELYVNTNNLVFPESPITHRDINNVVLPPWADNSPEKLVREMRKALESDQTSENLNEWIDLIWGVRRQGNLAFQRFNVLQPIIFQFDPEKYVNDRILMKAVIEQIHNCGQAPVQLFYDFHPKRNYSLQRKVTLVNVQNNLPYNDSMKMYKIKRDDDWFRLPNSYKVRICCGKIEYMHTKLAISQTGSAFSFADEIRPICIHTDNSEIVTGHKIPIINHWQATSIGLKHKATLRGHLEKISTVFISSQAKMIIAGHVDGKISTFTSDSHRFLRVLEGHLASPITKIVMCVATGNFVVVQKVKDKTVLTLFSVNGKMQTIREFDEQIKDVAVTNFPDGVHDNYFLVLTEKSLVLVKEGTLKTKDTFVLEEKPRAMSINIWNGTNVLISRDDRSLSLWTFVPQK
ncbi:Beige/BEACH domain containing protein [Trichomonas vaginalis G3]|uniref:Beige/BEACH domain containing protein n=1 Tax=Trichomonas vaginalis (strain ATCC PRA-98 / G3) TaxID=412133 RepID=A2G2F8_TRIV3|nr:aggrephagy protein [Trichomonas vaginalis G3]EAX88658.1 Beige/BEACH domain containing protein [Trichomonas vaginalis G3]KAI5485802.1 aggrephagy protein [Trichomonas vaginalis G3]|eukprot:XP_001301588.1 Beige/BEACH domain containing protein [Trichomonas vaginalis G3]